MSPAPIRIQSFAYLEDAFTDDSLDGDGLEDLIGESALHEEFWRAEMKQLDYDYYMDYLADEDEERDDADRSSGTLSEAARDLLRGALAREFGIAAKHLVGATPVEGPRPVGEFIEQVIDKMLVSPPAPQAEALPSRALAFGQPQIMEGRGQWDNARYFAADEDEK